MQDKVIGPVEIRDYEFDEGQLVEFFEESDGKDPVETFIWDRHVGLTFVNLLMLAPPLLLKITKEAAEKGSKPGEFIFADAVFVEESLVMKNIKELIIEAKAKKNTPRAIIGHMVNFEEKLKIKFELVKKKCLEHVKKDNFINQLDA